MTKRKSRHDFRIPERKAILLPFLFLHIPERFSKHARSLNYAHADEQQSTRPWKNCCTHAVVVSFLLSFVYAAIYFHLDLI